MQSAQDPHVTLGRVWSGGADDAEPAQADVRNAGLRCRRQHRIRQVAGVGMPCLAKAVGRPAGHDDAAEIHYGDAAGDVFDHGTDMLDRVCLTAQRGRPARG